MNRFNVSMYSEDFPIAFPRNFAIARYMVTKLIALIALFQAFVLVVARLTVPLYCSVDVISL